MNIFVIIILAFIALVVVAEWYKRSKSGPQADLPDASQLPTANEQLPTATGRYRVQQALNKPEEDTATSKEAATIGEDAAEGELLPDPFDKGSAGS